MRRPNFCQSSICARGYIARWEIKDKALLLVEIDGKTEGRFFFLQPRIKKYSIANLFGSVAKKVKADWYTGKLRIPNGQMTMYVHNNYESRFEKEIILTVEQGNVSKMVTLDYTKRALIGEPSPGF